MASHLGMRSLTTSNFWDARLKWVNSLTHILIFLIQVLYCLVNEKKILTLSFTNAEVRQAVCKTIMYIDGVLHLLAIREVCKQYFTFPSKQLINLINTHIKYTLSVPASRTKAVEYDRL